jgi:hypothetical protein
MSRIMGTFMAGSLMKVSRASDDRPFHYRYVIEDYQKAVRKKESAPVENYSRAYLQAS